jgi:GNAT superfamily N-acetyltransferase
MVYREDGAWKARELALHQERFPEGQFVAVDPLEQAIVGMAVSLVLPAARWPRTAPWREVTAKGTLATHDPDGDLLYGAGVAVSPEARGMGVARALYRAREQLLERLRLQCIRAGARIPGYRRVADTMTPEAYVERVVKGQFVDPTLSFQLHMGFRVTAVARRYLLSDQASQTHAAIVEWRAPSLRPTGGVSPSEPGRRLRSAMAGRDG